MHTFSRLSVEKNPHFSLCEFVQPSKSVSKNGFPGEGGVTDGRSRDLGAACSFCSGSALLHTFILTWGNCTRAMGKAHT